MGNRGYTLLELLVVLVIIGLLSGFVVLSLRGHSEPDRLDEAAERLTALVQLQCEEALLGNRSMRLQLDNSGYRFEVLTRSGWTDHGDPVFRERPWPVALAAQLTADGSALSGQDGIGCLPTGELTPFELTLRSRGGYSVTVRAGADGTMTRSGGQP